MPTPSEAANGGRPQHLADIDAVLHRYALALDRQDFEMLSSCFTADVDATYSGLQLPRGLDSLIELLRGVGRFSKSMHFVGTSVIDLASAEDVAHVVSYSIAYLVGGDEGANYLLTRGVRYTDDMIRQGGTWRIAKRVHEVDWSSESPATLAPTLPPEFQR